MSSFVAIAAAEFLIFVAMALFVGNFRETTTKVRCMRVVDRARMIFGIDSGVSSVSTRPQVGGAEGGDASSDLPARFGKGSRRL